MNARIRKRWLTGELEIISICAPNDLTYKVENLGNDIAILNNADIINTIKDFFQNSKFPMIILGDSILSTEEGENIHAITKKIADSCNVIKEDWNGFNILSPYASRAGGLEVGFIPTKNGINAKQMKKKILEKEIKLLFLIEADDFDIGEIDNESTKIVYLGHHGDKLASKADVILPITAFTEKKALYINIEGRPQFTKKIIQNKGLAVDGWKVFRALADKLGIKLKYNNHQQLLDRIFKLHPEISSINEIVPAKWIKSNKSIPKIKSLKSSFLVKNYYQSCPITRASINMANCIKRFSKKDESILNG